MTNTDHPAGQASGPVGGVPAAGDLLRGLIGEGLVTVAGAVNTILAVRPPDVIVATSKSPGGKPVPIAWIEEALNRLVVDGAVPITPAEIGYRSAFVGAVLKTI